MHYGFWGSGIRNLNGALLNENKVTATKLGLKKGDIVLDAGCGVGGSSIWMAENYGVKVTGITIVDKQVKLARKYAQDRGVDSLVCFENMDYCNTKFSDESFDKIFAMESMCYAQDKSIFLKEMYRVLKPGGTLVIADAFLDGRVLTKKDKLQLNDWLEGWAIPNIVILKDFFEYLDANSFVGLDDEDVKSLIMPSAKRIYNIGRIFFPFDWTCNKLRLLSDTTFKSTISSLSQYRLFSEGIMQYHLIKVEKKGDVKNNR